MVPNSWMSCHLGDFMEFKNGLNADKSQYGYGLKFVNVMDVFGNDILTEDKIIGRVNVAESQLESNLLKFGDVLFNRTSETFDEIAMSAVYLDDKPAVFGGFVIRARPSDGILAPTYSVYLFQSSKFRNQVIKLGQGAVQANIGQKDLAKVKVSIPPFPEQKKIAQILSTWDKAITTTEQLLANSQQQKKALMQQLLTGKKRLLDDNGVRFSGEWKIYHLSDLTKIVMGSSPKSAAYNEVGIGLPLLQGNADIKNRRSAPRIHTSEITRMCEVNDILLSVRAPVGTVALSNHHACIGRGIAAIRAKEDSNHNFIYQWLLWFEPRWISLSQGSTFESINSDDIKKLKIKSPKHEEQQKIAAVLSVADQEVDALTQKIDYLKQEKKALMQQLLTGKLRIINN